MRITDRVQSPWGMSRDYESGSFSILMVWVVSGALGFLRHQTTQPISKARMTAAGQAWSQSLMMASVMSPGSQLDMARMLMKTPPSLRPQLQA